MSCRKSTPPPTRFGLFSGAFILPAQALAELLEVAAVLVALNGISTMLCPFLMDVRIARETGHDGLLVVGNKLRRYLDEGFSTADARAALGDMPVVGLGNIRDVERASVQSRRDLLEEATAMCELSESIGCRMVQVLTGPLEPARGYAEPTSRERKDLVDSAARNLHDIGEIGERHDVSFYLEALAWTPLRRLADAVEIIERSGRSNVGLAVDFWHLWNSGARPEDVARLDGRHILCVDVADSIGPAGSTVGPDQRGRRVGMGEGAIPLGEWVDAVLATGFDGVWSAELLSPQHWELDPWKTAGDLRNLMRCLLHEGGA
jgi:sugar phosphate isomerase/epimerase